METNLEDQNSPKSFLFCLRNSCLFQEWLWKFCREAMTLWKRFIIEKFGLLNHWTIEEVVGTFGCSVWKTIRRLWPQFSTKISFKVAHDMKTKLWSEHWIGEDYLKATFPDLYNLSIQKSHSFPAMESTGWNLIFRRALNDWEVDVIANLLWTLNSFPGVSSGHDKPLWKLHC